MEWRIHHKSRTGSTNTDARGGSPGDVFTADFQTAGRGRLGHIWHSPSGANLIMSVVLPADGKSPEQVATLPLVAGLAVVRAVLRTAPDAAPALKWPNDVLVGGRKICGILCERNGDRVTAGIGINVKRQDFPPEIAERAASLHDSGFRGGVEEIRDAVLDEIGALLGEWNAKGFDSIWPEIVKIDYLRGRIVSVVQTDSDDSPVSGLCGGIRRDGSLDVGGAAVYAGEAHVASSKSALFMV